MSIRAVVFDYGGVLTTPVAASIAEWLATDGIRPESLTAVLREWSGRDALPGTPVHRLELGDLAEEEFGTLLAARLETYDGTPVSPEGVLSRLFAGMRPDAAMFALAGELRAAGVRTALLSNSWGGSYPRELIADFAPVVISGEVRLRKPDPAIYQLVLDGLGVPAGSCLFVDDNEPNVRGAEAVGMRGLLHADAGATQAALAELVPALVGGAHG